MNYSELTTLVQTTMENYETTFVASIDGFIKAAEQRIYRQAKVPATNKNQTAALTASSRYLSMPTGFVSVNEIDVQSGGASGYLLPKDVSFIREAYPDPTVEGRPKYYAQFDEDTLLLAPTPDQNYTVEMHYFGYPESIVTAGTTWLGDNFDQALLYGTLVEAAIWLKYTKEELEPYYERFRSALALVQEVASKDNVTDNYRTQR